MGLPPLFCCLSLLIALHQVHQSQCTSSSARLLKFIPVLESRDTDIYVEASAGGVLEVDAAHQSQVSVVAIHLHVGLRIVCRVDSLSKYDAIQSYIVCRKPLSDYEPTKNPTTECEVAKNGQKIFTYFEVTLEDNGMILTYTTLPATVLPLNLLSGMYSCKMQNRYGSIESNWYQLRYLKEYRDKIKGEIKRESKLLEWKSPYTPKDLPLTFDCITSGSLTNTEKWLSRQHYGSPFTWSGCSPKQATLTKDQCRLNDLDAKTTVDLNAIGDHVILPNGTLVFFTLKNKVDNVNLLCFDDSNAVWSYNFYGYTNLGNIKLQGGLNFDPNGPEYTGPPQPLSESIVQKIVFHARKKKSNNYPFKLNAMYKSSKAPLHQWKKDGQALSPDQGFVMKHFQLDFPDEVNASHSGMYTLEVDGATLFSYNVFVETVPYFTNADQIFHEKFVMNKESVSISYKMSQPNVKKTLFINGFPIHDGSEKLFTSEIPKLNKPLNQLSVDLLINDTSNDFQATSELTYQVSNLVCEIGTGVDNCQGHTVSMELENEYGGSRVHSVLKALPYPKADEFPEKTSCNKTECLENKNIIFRCKFPLDVYRKEGAYVRRFWTVGDDVVYHGNTTLDNNRTVQFQLENENETLTVLNATRNMRGIVVTCRLVLFYPAAQKFDKSSIEEIMTKKDLIMFDTGEATYEHRASMTAVISFYTPPNTAHIGWIVGAIIAFILIMLLIAFIVYRVSTRKPKESYNVDEQERDIGNDPLKEIREEEFHTYNRDGAENGNLLGPDETPPVYNTNMYATNGQDAPDVAIRPSNNTMSREPRVTYRQTTTGANLNDDEI